MLRILFAFAAGALLASAVFLLKPLLSSPPPSPHISEAAQQAMGKMRDQLAPHMKDMITGDAETRRAILNEHFFAPRIAEARRLYPVEESVLEIDGVYTEVFTPVGGVPASRVPMSQPWDDPLGDLSTGTSSRSYMVPLISPMAMTFDVPSLHSASRTHLLGGSIPAAENIWPWLPLWYCCLGSWNGSLAPSDAAPEIPA